MSFILELHVEVASFGSWFAAFGCPNFSMPVDDAGSTEEEAKWQRKHRALLPSQGERTRKELWENHKRKAIIRENHEKEIHRSSIREQQEIHKKQKEDRKKISLCCVCCEHSKVCFESGSLQTEAGQIWWGWNICFGEGPFKLESWHSLIKEIWLQVSEIPVSHFVATKWNRDRPLLPVMQL